MKNAFYGLLVAALFLLSSCKEHDAYCQSILNKPMAGLSDNSGSTKDKMSKLASDIEILQKCGHMDSIDKFIWQAPTVGVFIVSMSPTNHTLTYGDVLHVIDSVRATPFYQQMRKAVANGELPPGVVDHTNAEAEEPKEPYTFQSFSSLDDCLSVAKRTKRDVLLYFSAHYNVNSRMMEQKVFTDKELKDELKNNYDSYILYADEETLVPGKKMTVGDYIIDLQDHRFNANSQPYFVILNPSGKTLRSSSYTSKPEEFLQFIKSR